MTSLPKALWPLQRPIRELGEAQEEWPMSTALLCAFYQPGPLSVVWGPGLEQIFMFSDVMYTLHSSV